MALCFREKSVSVPEIMPPKQRLIFRGLRVQMGCAYGRVASRKPLNTGQPLRLPENGNSLPCFVWAFGLSRMGGQQGRCDLTWYDRGTPQAVCIKQSVPQTGHVFSFPLSGRADYFGNLPNTAARVMSLANPGQFLIEGSIELPTPLFREQNGSATTIEDNKVLLKYIPR